MTSNTPHILIVGAGIAGLSAGRQLQAAGWRVTILDKGRGVGGRMATRRFEGGVFDHGAQFFTVRDTRFQQMVDQWLANGSAIEWSKGFPDHATPSTPSGHPRYRGVAGMTNIPKDLAKNLDIRLSTQVNQISLVDGQWQLSATHLGTNDTGSHVADMLLMTPPAEQTLRLMRSGNVELPVPITSALEKITFDPCFAVLALLDRPSRIPAPGAVTMPGEPIRFIADNQQKGISENPAITIHAGPTFTREHYDNDKSEVAQLLLSAAQEYLGDAHVISVQVQRWRYSQPTQLHPEKALFSTDPAPIAFAGDAFGAARVEGAVLSGFAAAEKLLNAV